MGRVFSVDLDDKSMKNLEEIMGMHPIKSRNGVIRHIINTYLLDRDNHALQTRIDSLMDIIKIQGQSIDGLESEIRDIRKYR